MAEPNGSRGFAAAAAGLGIEVRIRQFPEGTRTAVDAAAAVGCELAQIVKSLVFLCDEVPMLVLTSGSHRVDTARLGEVLAGRVALADADTARSVTGYDVGGIPPFGHKRQLPVVVDAALLRHERVWAAAGTPDTVFETSSAELVRCTGGTVMDLTSAGDRQGESAYGVS